MSAMPNIHEAKSNVVPLTGLDQIERAADLHRRFAATHEQKATDARRAGKRRLAEIAAAKKAEKERHLAEMARLDELAAAAKEQAEADVDANRKLAAASRAALDLLAE